MCFADVVDAAHDPLGGVRTVHGIKMDPADPPGQEIDDLTDGVGFPCFFEGSRIMLIPVQDPLEFLWNFAAGEFCDAQDLILVEDRHGHLLLDLHRDEETGMFTAKLSNRVKLAIQLSDRRHGWCHGEDFNIKSFIEDIDLHELLEEEEK